MEGRFPVSVPAIRCFNDDSDKMSNFTKASQDQMVLAYAHDPAWRFISQILDAVYIHHELPRAISSHRRLDDGLD